MTETPERLAQAFVAALAKDFTARGAAAIAKARSKHPAAYLRLIAALVPQEVDRRSPLERLSDDELEAAIAALTRQTQETAAR